MNRNTPATKSTTDTPTRDRCWGCNHEPRVPPAEEVGEEIHAAAVARWFTGGLCPVCFDYCDEFGITGPLADALDAMLDDVPSDP